MAAPGRGSRAGNKSLQLTGLDGQFAANHVRQIVTGEPASILIVAVNGDQFADAIQGLFPSSDIHIRPATPGQFPSLPNKQYELVLSFDLMSTLSQGFRQEGWRRLDYLAASEFLVCEPLGTDLQQMIYHSLLDYQMERKLQPDLNLVFAKRLDLPTPDEALGWAGNRDNIDIYFAGDVTYFRSAAERAIKSAGKSKLFGLLIRKAGLDNPEGGATDLESETVPMRRHRRLYLHRAKG